MNQYRFTRDDGVQLQVVESAWEFALELAYRSGWKPAGTEAPRTHAWRERCASPGPHLWDRQDYFTHQSQRVGQADARAIARGVARALKDVGGWPASGGDGAAAPAVLPRGATASRPSAKAEGLSASKWNAMCRFIDFANSGGFTIGGVH